MWFINFKYENSHLVARHHFTYQSCITFEVLGRLCGAVPTEARVQRPRLLVRPMEHPRAWNWSGSLYRISPATEILTLTFMVIINYQAHTLFSIAFRYSLSYLGNHYSFRIARRTQLYTGLSFALISSSLFYANSVSPLLSRKINRLR